MRLARVHYPWPSMLLALALVAWQFVLANRGILPPGALPELLQSPDNLLIGIAALVLLAILDFWLYLQSSARSRAQLRQFQQRIDELFETRRELGTRARTYSDHADKLKMFISERLLEYIEYDEKFLHFKNIASEVRHNGVISYDKAQTALKRALASCPPEERRLYEDAAAGLLYLWDLLDLSTTDNLALHVANRIYDCEEHYFQSQLQGAADEPSPFRPTFMMSHALRRALLPITENPDDLRLNDDWQLPLSLADDKFRIELEADAEMLGNENHMVLLLENLLNNALFYSGQKGYAGRYTRVGIVLARVDDDVEVRVYNRGPWIREDEKDKIYQLGFSSRRIREHHGKGLGLYFVNEIAKGFEGVVAFKNIEIREQECALSIKLGNGELHQHRVELVDVDGKPMCRLEGDGEQARRKIEWSFSAPVASVEIGAESRRKPQLLSALARGESSIHLDDANPLMPHWVVDISNRKRSSSLRFTPLDVRGVQFVARFPSARSRLDNPD